MLFAYVAFILLLVPVVYSSYGDQSAYYQKCTEKCLILNCTEDGVDFLQVDVQPFYLKLWNCQAECEYECMWKTTDAFKKRDWRVPQFYGKWPFIRILGIQEPASVAFSLLNIYSHYSLFKKFKRRVRNDAPLYWLWLGYCAVNINTWIWSSIFHTRDVPFTEFMDYTCAFSVVMFSCYCMVMRIFYGMPKYLKILISSFYLAFFVNHVLYLSYGGFDYGYNMKLNITIGAVTVISWFSWSVWNRVQQPYLWKCAAFYALTAFVIILEVFDFPPVFWTFDSHSLWHLVTAFLWPLYYSFITDDSLYLKKQGMHID